MSATAAIRWRKIMPIGVGGYGSIVNTGKLSEQMKHNSLFFDKIYLSDLSYFKSLTNNNDVLLPEIEYLMDKGLVQNCFELSNLFSFITEISTDKNNEKPALKLVEFFETSTNDSVSSIRLLNKITDLIGEVEDLSREYANISLEDFPEHQHKIDPNIKAHEVMLRMLGSDANIAYIEAFLLRLLRQTDAICIDPFWIGSSDSNVDRNAKDGDLYEIVINGLLLPDGAVPWEDILAFRSESSSQQQLRALRLWIGEMAKGKLTYAQAVDQIEYLKQEYRVHMKGAGIRARNSTLRTLVVGVADIAESAIKLKLKDLAEFPFKLLDAKADLIDADRKAVGRELAYVVRAEDRFRL
jgi:hypothetical protein